VYAYCAANWRGKRKRVQEYQRVTSKIQWDPPALPGSEAPALPGSEGAWIWERSWSVHPWQQRRRHRTVGMPPSFTNRGGRPEPGRHLAEISWPQGSSQANSNSRPWIYRGLVLPGSWTTTVLELAGGAWAASSAPNDGES
jgi:hypothetical protein